KENEELINLLKQYNSRKLIKEKYNWLYEIIYSPKRLAGLELLELTGEEVCVDYGCMWGSIAIGLSKICACVLGIDQTKNSLEFLKKRILEEKIDNLFLLNTNLHNQINFDNFFDISIVNGVLEWIPETNEIELKKYFGKKQNKEYKISNNPKKMQEQFLKMVYNNLKHNGKLYLAIENRFDFKCMLGHKDPHSNIRFTSIFPRKISDLFSYIFLSRKYVNWLYSFDEIKYLLENIGFKNIELFMVFPDYRFPEKIIPYNKRLTKNEIANFFLKEYTNKCFYKKKLASIYSNIIFKIINPNFFSPSIIVIAKKC
ncbi:MAG TPA: methyltransferase domain-containing protein, partial [bacterium]|nr:methyltransferase domain-containing protein [bacterium]